MDILLLIFLVFFAYVVRTLTGFGSVVLLSPILSSIFGPKNAVILVVLMESFISIIFAVKERLNFDLKEVYFGSFVGALIGYFFFESLSERELGIAIGLSLIVLSLALIFDVKYRVREEKPLFFFSGFLSGSLGVLSGVTGPQVVIALVNQGYDSKFVRRFMISYLSVVYATILTIFIFSGHVSYSILSKFLVCIPSIALAYFFGKRIVLKIDSKKLEKVILIVVLISSLSLILKYL
ncbi:protein of unknown function DUF81 [Ferroglobus placidus DSM 10642]|uniref:Probable membrane transporter protein n=1 Tax=Ferroglobus placidus (strain DSM 10642 / AEDII12DO) TaxID=589924 RepID=D3RYC4_FERPA|nr:sulfite exporter TauE/SafE family protein [Ferroglobus placidus]ADC65487.1 protein of unknown function DUF81 [Ferroglobus placidus DSM 10642]